MKLDLDNTPIEEQKYQPKPVSPPVVETDFAELQDESLVETIKDPNDPVSSIFVIYKDGAIRYERTVEYQNQVLVPIPRKAENARAC